jgi:hypothetical protein
VADSNAALRDQLLERPIRAIDIPTSTADRELVQRVCLLVGWSLRETTGSATATAEFFAAQGTAGPRVGEQQMASGASGSLAIANEGVLCEAGVNLHVVSGSVAGCIWVRV